MGIIRPKKPQLQTFLTKVFVFLGVLGVMGVMELKPITPIKTKKCDTPFGLWVYRPKTRFSTHSYSYNDYTICRS